MRKSDERRRKSDLDLFASLYDQAFPVVYNYVRFGVLDQNVAEDLTAEAFYRAWRSFARFDEKRAKFSTWVVAIARNVMVDYWRREKATSALDDVPDSSLAFEDDYPTINQTAEQVQHLLEYLSPDDREIIYMKFYRDMRNIDIAAELNMNESTVASRASRALEKMRAHL